MNSLRIFFTIAAQEDLELRQGDLKTAFLTANLVETVYMNQPTAYERTGKEGQKLVAHLLMAIYGLKQSPLNPSSELFSSLDFHTIEADHCLYVGWKDGRRRMLIQYVDDFIVAGSKGDVPEVVGKTKDRFTIDDRENPEDGMMLGTKIKRNRAKRTILLT